MRTGLASAIASLLIVPNGGAQSVSQQPLPQRVGQTFIIADWNGVVTQTDLGFGNAGGNQGTVDVPSPGITTMTLVPDSVTNASGGALRVGVNFAGIGNDGLGALFVVLHGLSDTLVSLDGSTPVAPTTFPDYSADWDDYFRGFQPWAGRTIERLSFRIRLAPASPSLTIKVELKDEAGRDVFTRIPVTSSTWGEVRLDRAAFTRSLAGSPSAFDWRHVDKCSLLVEKFVSGEVSNPSGAFEVDDLGLEDVDGSYPDLAAAANPDGTLQAHYSDAFLDYVSRLSMLYFIDFACTDPRTGGMTLDRSSFADLITVGGVPFQIAAWITAAERGAIAHPEARSRTLALLRVMADSPMGPERVGRIGYRGFYYHFLGIDGRRKQNFDRPQTPAIDESLNTVELSYIDTVLAAVGVTMAREFWTGDSMDDTEIRAHADTILSRIDWPFMLQTLPDGKRQFALGWKPIETRDDYGLYGRFLLPDADGSGHFSSRNEGGVEQPATGDYHSTEFQLGALLSMASPNPAFRLGPEVWNDVIRQGSPFVKSWPGSLFTYTWLHLFTDTRRLGVDNHPSRPVNWFNNTASAIGEVRSYVAANPGGLVSLSAGFTGFEPCEGPFDNYAAIAPPSVALANTPAGSYRRECEDLNGAAFAFRGNASGAKTLRTAEPGSFSTTITIPATQQLRALVRYSNDGPSDSISLRMDGQTVGSFTTISTGSGGFGWNNFTTSPLLGPVTVSAGAHTLTLTVDGTDQYGVEPDLITIYGPMETGTLTSYGTIEQLPWVGTAAINELFRLARHDLYTDGRPSLLHGRFGCADAFQAEIAEALLSSGFTGAEPAILRASGPWSNMTGFAINHGPAALTIGNWLDRGLIQALFTKNPGISAALAAVFPSRRTPFEQWTLDHFASTTAPEAMPAADSDFDGLVNLAEYATGGDPRRADASPPAIAVDTNEFIIRMPVDIRAAASLSVETSGDLTEWAAPAVSTQLVSRNGDGIVTMEFRIPSPQLWKFFRLRIAAQ